jgi:predicted O-linked N-acetylglucosamine transferase (SPINDLY family)
MSHPESPTAALERARALYEAGYLAEAGRAYQAVLVAEPRQAEALWRLGDVANRLGMHDDALSLVQSSLAEAPGDKHAWNCLGTVHVAAGRPQEAFTAFSRAIAIAPNFMVAISNLGKLYGQLGRLDEAVTAHRMCALAEPHVAAHRVDLGNAHLAREEWDAALAAFKEGASIDPAHVEAQLGIGIALARRGDNAAAADVFASLVAAQPGLAAARSNLALALFGCGRIEEAVDAFRTALAVAPGDARAHANLIFALDLDPRAGLEDTMAERRRWVELHAAAAPAASHDNDRDPGRRLRIGYVSGDLKSHSAAEALAPLLLGHTAAFEVVCYSEVRKADAVTERFRSAAALWRESWQLSDDALAARIRDDRIDILVDLSGFSQGNRLAVFARKPAPVQVQGWGYPLGSGMRQMDYLMSDPVLIPARHRHLFAETVHDLPCFMPFAVPAESPALVPPPCEANGFVTFGSMNRFAKINASVLDTWGRILTAVPDARLLAKDPAFESEQVHAWMTERLAARGVAPRRITLLGRTSRRQHLAAYAEVDVALDPFPQSGGVTTFETLWMGVPLVTLAGERPQGRASASILAAVGLDGAIARSEDDYVDVAVRWAGDRNRLRATRMDLRNRLRQSIMCDQKAYCATVEAAFRGFWKAWCAGPR